MRDHIIDATDVWCGLEIGSCCLLSFVSDGPACQLKFNSLYCGNVTKPCFQLLLCHMFSNKYTAFLYQTSALFKGSLAVVIQHCPWAALTKSLAGVLLEFKVRCPSPSLDQYYVYWEQKFLTSSCHLSCDVRAIDVSLEHVKKWVWHWHRNGHISYFLYDHDFCGISLLLQLNFALYGL